MFLNNAFDRIAVGRSGMTNANMKLVVISVLLADKMEYPEQKLDTGEYITKRVVELAKLSDELKGKLFREFLAPSSEIYFM